MPSQILLQNGTILVPSGDADDYVLRLRGHSQLIEDNKISLISPYTIPSPGAEVIDCTDKIISPGFVDTHHHVWQTQLKGRHADQSFMEYIPTGEMSNCIYKPEDVFWGELGGCLEALDAGTTTLVDRAYMDSRPACTANAIEATISSVIQSVFCYAPAMRWKRFRPQPAPDGSLFEDWVAEYLQDLGAAAPFGDVVFFYERARKLGAKVITSHYRRSPSSGRSLMDALDDLKLLGFDIPLSHATNLTQSDIEKLKEAKAWISTTPDTELQMGHGNIVCFRDGCSDISSLGIDCHSNNSADMVSQMRLALQHELLAQGKGILSLNLFVQDVFRLGTIQGARAVQMGDQVGSIEVGKLADIVVFDGTSPGMVCAAEQDPVAAIVLHSSIRDIDMVIVDGRIRKLEGKLCPVDIHPTQKGVTIPQQKVEWKQVARELVLSRGRIEEFLFKVGADDSERFVQFYMDYFRFDKDKFVKLSRHRVWPSRKFDMHLALRAPTRFSRAA